LWGHFIGGVFGAALSGCSYFQVDLAFDLDMRL
jgi:hypothetical protein